MLKLMVSSSGKVAKLNSEIAAASKEQANGISQISKAMSELDQTVQRNSDATAQVSVSVWGLR